MKRKAIVSSILTIALCLSIIAGSTYALFTDRKELDVSVTAGNVELEAYYDTSVMKTWSLGQTEADARLDGKFENGGTAQFVKTTVDGNEVSTSVVIDKMTPGDVAKFMIVVNNYSNINIQYRVRMESVKVEILDDAGNPTGTYYTDLTSALVTTAYIDGFNYELMKRGNEVATDWKFADANEDIDDVWVTVNFPNSSDVIAPKDAVEGDPLYNKDNQFQNARAEIFFAIEAVQANGVPFKAVNDLADMLDANGYISDGNFNGEGATILVETNAEQNGSSINVAGNTTISNVTLNGTNLYTSSGNPFVLYAVEAQGGGTEEPTTVILANDTTVVAPKSENGDITSAVCFLRNGPAYDVVMLDGGSKIVADGADAFGIFVQSTGGEVSVVLNGAELIEATGGAIGLCFVSNDFDPANYLTVKIFVENDTDIAYYEAMLYAANTNVQWYVAGTYYKTVTYNA